MNPKKVENHCSRRFLLSRFHVGTFGGTTSQLVYLQNPGDLSADEASWTNWEETVIIEGGLDVYFEMVTLNDPDGKEYSVLVGGEFSLQI